jgi:hypothetical protein
MSSAVSQSHLTLAFAFTSPADADELAPMLTALMPDMFRAQDAIGTVHYSRFTVLSEKTVLFLADFDGEFGQLMRDLATRAGPVFDKIFAHVNNPPQTPVAHNAEAFAEWAAEHLLHPAFVYTAYTGATAGQIKGRAADADVKGTRQPNLFLVILSSKSRLAFVEMQTLLRAMGMVGKVRRDLDKVGTPHFAQFVPLEDRQLGFFTVFDGSFDKYIDDFTRNIGEVFDVLFKFTKDAPPSPCRKHVQEFIDFATAANRTPIGFYQAYPGLTVQDIKALLVDSGAEAVSG